MKHRRSAAAAQTLTQSEGGSCTSTLFSPTDLTENMQMLTKKSGNLMISFFIFFIFTVGFRFIYSNIANNLLPTFNVLSFSTETTTQNDNNNSFSSFSFGFVGRCAFRVCIYSEKMKKKKNWKKWWICNSSTENQFIPVAFRFLFYFFLSIDFRSSLKRRQRNSCIFSDRVDGFVRQ